MQDSRRPDVPVDETFCLEAKKLEDLVPSFGREGRDIEVKVGHWGLGFRDEGGFRPGSNLTLTSALSALSLNRAHALFNVSVANLKASSTWRLQGYERQRSDVCPMWTFSVPNLGPVWVWYISQAGRHARTLRSCSAEVPKPRFA